MGKRAERGATAQALALKISNAVQDRLATFESALLDTRSFLNADPKLGRRAFARYVNGLELPLHHPGIFSLGFARWMPRNEVGARLREVRAGGAPEFTIWPAGARELTVPVIYVEPMNQTRAKVLGWDMWSEPIRREAMERAIETGAPALTQRVRLVAEDKLGSSFLLIVPVFREGRVPSELAERRRAILGFVFAPIKARDFFTLIAAEELHAYPGLTVEVFDGPTKTEADRLFGHNVRPSAWNDVAHEENVRIDRVGQWVVRVRTTPAVLGEGGIPVVLEVLGLGVLISLLIWFLFAAARTYADSLEKSQSLIGLIADSLPALVAYIDRERRYRYVNRAYTAWFGIDAEDLRGQPASRVLEERYESFYRPLLDRALAGEKVEFEHSMSVAGRTRILRSRYVPDLAGDGEVVGLVALVDDVTDEKAFQDRLRDERRISELVNEVGLFLQAELESKKLEQRITNAATELTGAEAGCFSPTFDGDSILRVDDVTVAPTITISALEWSGTRGPLRSYLAVPVISRRGEVLGGLHFGHSRPAAFNDRAETLVAGIAAQAAVALDNAKLYSEAQAINRVKDEFLATLSHELRTPLNVILGYSDLLREEELPAEIHAHVDAIYRNAKSQNQLIADLLDISAIITGKITFHPRRLNGTDVVANAIQNIRFAAETKGVHLEAKLGEEPCELHGDPTRLQQIVWNLLTNAVKFTPGGGTVKVEARAKDGEWVIAVSDTGIGMESEFLPYVFDRFRQEDSGRSRRFGGLGLGLSIVRQLVEMHGGSIRVSSAGKNQGSTFTVTLPLA